MLYLKFAKRNIRRSPFQAVAASMVMFLTFFVMLVFLLLAAGSEKILKYYESKPQVIAFFKDGTTQNDIIAIQNALSQTGAVTTTKYISKEEALAIYRDRNKSDPALLELVTASILPASLEVSTTTPKDLKPTAEILKREPVVDEVIVPEDVVAQLTNATKIIRWVGGVTVAFLILFSTLVILMVIGFKIRLKRQEIEIMRLMGASSSFIRAPFILEGNFYGLVGAIGSWIFVNMILWYFTPWIQSYLGEVRLLPVDALFILALLGAQIVVAIIIGGLGSIGAVRRYLQT
jgi:cell division transport system permease protein